MPVLLMSANPQPARCHLPVLPKPFSLEALLTLIARTLPRSPVAAVARADLGAK